jgi:hypothetical protein
MLSTICLSTVHGPSICRECKGFGSEVRRFGSDETDNPGPGTYGVPIPVKEVQHKDSMSKKGYGPLTSKATRFKNKACYTGPGPGTYAAPQSIVTVSSSPYPQHPTACFHRKVGSKTDQV